MSIDGTPFVIGSEVGDVDVIGGGASAPNPAPSTAQARPVLTARCKAARCGAVKMAFAPRDTVNGPVATNPSTSKWGQNSGPYIVGHQIIAIAKTPTGQSTLPNAPATGGWTQVMNEQPKADQ